MIPVLQTRSATEQGFYFKRAGKPAEIRIKPGSNVELTTLHEAGHYLTDTYFTREEFSKVIDAAGKTALLRAKKKSLSGEAADYFFDEGEIFARAYSQYIMEKKAPAALLQGNLRGIDFQWEKDDFSDILKTFDNILTKKGDLK